MLINGPSPWSTAKCRVVLFYVQSALPLLVTFFFLPARVKNTAEDSCDIHAITTNFCGK